MTRLLIFILIFFIAYACNLPGSGHEKVHEIKLADHNGTFAKLILQLPQNFGTLHVWERLNVGRCFKFNNTRIQDSRAGVDQEKGRIHIHQHKTVDQVTITNYIYPDCSNWTKKRFNVNAWFEYQRNIFSWDVYNPEVLMLDSIMVDSVKLGVIGATWNNHREYEGNVHEIKAAGIINRRFVQITFLSNRSDQTEYFKNTVLRLKELKIKNLQPTKSKTNAAISASANTAAVDDEDPRSLGIYGKPH